MFFYAVALQLSDFIELITTNSVSTELKVFYFGKLSIDFRFLIQNCLNWFSQIQTQIIVDFAENKICVSLHSVVVFKNKNAVRNKSNRRVARPRGEET